MSPETKRKPYKGNYRRRQVRAMHLAAQYLEIPFRVIAREGEQYLSAGTAKPDLSSNITLDVPRETRLVPEGYAFVQFDLLNGEGTEFWNRVTLMDKNIG